MAAHASDNVLLGLLAARPQHGYLLIESFRDPGRLGTIWRLSTSQLYAVLKRLETLGLIAGRALASPDAPNRTEYALTEAGWARLEAWLAEAAPSADPECVRVEFLSRLYIARLLNLPTTDIVRAQRDACAQRRAELVRRRDRAAAGIEWLALEYDIAQAGAILDWIARCELVPRDNRHQEG